jgi:hypothetical protein
MAEDRLRRDFDDVENLKDIIPAREERRSAFSDDVDAMEDIDYDGIPRDASEQLTYPHPKTRAEEDGALGINVDLMSTPDENEVEFDWQDNAEEMLPADPDPSEGMGEDSAIEAIAHVSADDIAGPVPSVEVGEETGTAATREEMKEYGIEGEEPALRPEAPVPLDSAMDSESDEDDYSIEDKFAGDVDREEAELDFEEMDRMRRQGKGES